MIIASSQRFLDEEIVEEKMAGSDFRVTISPEITFAGRSFSVILDGHHRLAAAQRLGREYEVVVADTQSNDSIALLDAGCVEDFLMSQRNDSDYYDVVTGDDLW